MFLLLGEALLPAQQYFAIFLSINGDIMQKLWIGLSVIISLLLSGCTSNHFKLPVPENPEALKRFDKPIQYS